MTPPDKPRAPNEGSPQADLALLRWYIEAGADEAVGDAPVNRYEQTPQEQAGAVTSNKDTPHPSEPRADPAAPGPPPAFAAMATPTASDADSRALAAECSTLEELRHAIDTFPGFALKATAKHMVFADGVPGSPVMFIGEAPGREEDLQGLPFVGPAGQLLDRMLAAIGRDRSCVYISNILNWRPPGNRTPTPAEALMALPFIKRHIVLAKPKVVVLLGGTAAKHLLATTTGIMRLRGKWTELMLDEFGEQVIPALPTLHPAYLLRQPAHKRLAWQDFLSLKLRLREIESEDLTRA